MDFAQKLKSVEQKIDTLQNSDGYKTLAKKNSVWFVKYATDDEKADWELLREKLARLKDRRRDYVQIILSQYAHAVNKADNTRKKYKKDTAIRDERLLLSDVATKLWKRFRFAVVFENSPSFDDLMKATGFFINDQVHDYFRKREQNIVELDLIKESLSEKQWIKLIGLNSRVNHSLQDTLIEQADGSIRLVLEHEVYQDGAKLLEDVVKSLYGSEKEVDIQVACND
ncbi:hypothetical protein MP228_003627 [Amoeboaphelidium protococcarum]|nr:hypothetical protein MP228_003627 [Amoeboaphelidium protococcarum]